MQGSNVWNAPVRVSEDCLYLNVWVPRDGKHAPRKTAVMVWIHGGGFYSGTTTLGVYDGKIISALNNVIVVSIGYRVGAFGFLSLGHNSAPGNAGMFDQLVALEWIQQNIHYFGGDPQNVTLFGQDAGSVSVSLHLLSPLSRSKFQRAILQSGVATMPWATLTAYEARRRALELAFHCLRCPETDDMELVADCLRRVPPLQLDNEQFVTRGLLQFPFLPVIDGVFLPDNPEHLLRTRAFKKCPLLVGSNANEGSWYIIYELPDLNLTHMSMTRGQFQISVEKLFYYYPRFPQVISPIALDAIRYQYTNWKDEDNMQDNIRMLDAAIGDGQFICQVNQWADVYSKSGQSVYSYFLTQVKDFKKLPGS